MPETGPARLATVRRGTALEAVVRGHAAVVDPTGRVVGAAGDPATPTTLRSCVKPIQALAFVRHALDTIGAGAAELAIACASHSGEPRHVEVVRSLLSLGGVGEDALSCGPQLPFDEDAARQLLSNGGGPDAIHNNCSGKHAAMLATCAVLGWPLGGYARRDHPLQAEIADVLGGLAGTDLAHVPVGVDGCGLDTYGLPLSSLARIFAAADADPDFQRCEAAMAAHPHLVAGNGRFDTVLLSLAGDEITLKGGGGAVWAAVRRHSGQALAIKLEAGDATAMPAVALAALGALEWLSPHTLADPRLDLFAQPRLRNWEGSEVGSIRVDAGWTAQLAG